MGRAEGGAVGPAGFGDVLLETDSLACCFFFPPSCWLSLLFYFILILLKSSVRIKNSLPWLLAVADTFLSCDTDP